MVDQSLPVSESFKEVNKVLRDGVASITNVIMTPGEINVDYADIVTVMKGKGRALFGTGNFLLLLVSCYRSLTATCASGESEGEERARNAIQKALNNPLLEDLSVKGARAVLINITSGPDLTLKEVSLVFFLLP